MTLLDFFLRLVYGDPTWPPKFVQEHWEQVAEYRRRFDNDFGEMLQNTPRMNSTLHRRGIYTPVPLAREMARFSAALLFSEAPKIILPDEEEKKRRAAAEERQAARDARNPFLNRQQPEKDTPAETSSNATTTKVRAEVSEEEAADGSVEKSEATLEKKIAPPRKSRRQKLLERLLDLNGIDAFLQDAAERVAAEGVGAIRVIRDEDVAEGEPFLTFVPEDQILWDIRHGRAVVGAAAIWEYMPYEVEPDHTTREIYRMIEEHVPGTITRKVHKGTVNQLGAEIPESQWPEVWEGTKPVLETGLDYPTMIRWENVPGGHSDITGLDALLDNLDEAESLMLDKGRKSIPKTFADRALADDQGELDLEGIILTGEENMAAAMGDTPVKTVETVQPELQTPEHVEWINHIREMIVTHAGYSRASWGMGEEGRTDSGTALALRQARTLLTKAGKDRMAREAIRNAVAVALAWMDGASKIQEYRPEVMLGTGLPEDVSEKANAVTALKAAGLISERQAVRFMHPDWSEDQVDEELTAIEEEKGAPPALGDPKVAQMVNALQAPNDEEASVSGT
jgi:hypothetical protein